MWKNVFFDSVGRMKARSTVGRATSGAVVTAFLCLILLKVRISGFSYILLSMQQDLGFSRDSANSLEFTPSAAGLLVVFVAGALSDRWGPRRMLAIGITLFIIGAVIVGLAPNLIWIVIGRILDGIGIVTIAIVALSLINTTVTDPGKRARVFGFYAAATPAVFMLAPPVTALIVETAGWRAVLIFWVVLGLITLVAMLRYVPKSTTRAGGEMVTPLLAGAVLAGASLSIISLATSDDFAVFAAAIAVVALFALIVIMRRSATTTLDFRWCRGRGLIILVVALCVASMPDLFFYTNMLLQYRYSVPIVFIALLLVVPQGFAVVGGLLSGPVSARIGPAKAALIALLVSAVTCLATLFVTPDAPIWVPVLVLSVIAVPTLFLVGPITNTFLSRAPAESSGAAASINKAAGNIGGVFGGALVGALSFAAYQNRMAGILNADGLPFPEAELIAGEIRGGAAVAEVAARISDPVAKDALVSMGPGLLDAQSYSYAVVGLVSAGLFLAGAVLMFFYLRRSTSPSDVGAGHVSPR